MMKIKTSHFGLCLFLAIGLLSCDRTPITGSPEENITFSQGTPTDEITWVSWKQDVVDQINDLKLLKGSANKMIVAGNGGTVGGSNTFDNKVEIPAGALADNTFISIDVICVDGKDQCGAGIDFLPSMQFLKDVKVTLSWEFINYDGGDLTFYVYYSEDDGGTWSEAVDVEIDYDNETVSIYVDHFTRFAWGL